MVCAETGIDKATMSLTLHGSRPFSKGPNGTHARFFEKYPIPPDFEPPSEAKPAGPRTSAGDRQNPESVWINTNQAHTTDLCRVAEDAKLQRDEVDRLVSHEEYQQMRSAVLQCAPANVATVLLAPPELGPCVAMRRALDSVRESIAESERRQGTIDPAKSSELYRRHSSYREALRRKIEKLERGDDVDDLMATGAWSSTLTALRAMFRGHAEDRAQCIAVLGGLPRNTFASRVSEMLSNIRDVEWPSNAFLEDPVGFVRTYLGDDPWGDDEHGQVAMLKAFVANQLTVVPSGRDGGKTRCVAWLCIGWFTTPQGRVCLSNFTGAQLYTQDWAEILRCLSRSGICYDCRQAGVTKRPCPHSQVIPERPSEDPVKGLWSDDRERYIVGITGKETTSLGGYHGERLAVVCDEFSGLNYGQFNAWKGNFAAAGCKFIGPGNCLDGPGSPMHDAVQDKRIQNIYGWKVVHINVEDLLPYKFPWAPSEQMIRAQQLEDDRGRDNPLYMINVRGEYPTIQEDCIYSIQDVIRAQEPEIYAAVVPSGQLIISFDPAKSSQGDESVLAATRGLKVLEFVKWRGTGSRPASTFDDLALEKIIDLYRAHSGPAEQALLAIDADGVGANIIRRVYDYLDTARIPASEKIRVEVLPVYFGHEAVQKFDYQFIGDEAHVYLAKWLRNGGVFPVDRRLEQEMQYSRWFRQSVIRNDRQLYVARATRKIGTQSYQELIHRSPDTLDALRVMAVAAYMRDILPIPETVSQEAKQDIAAIPQPPMVDESQAFNAYLTQLRRGSNL